MVRITRNSLAGLKSAFIGEPAFRQEIFVCCILVPAAIVLGEDGIERALLIGSLFIVLIAEVLNTAIETVVDRIGLERDELSGRAKDLGSAAVFVSLTLAAVVWGFILFG